MNLTTPNLLMGGVALLGAFAAFKMVTSRPEPEAAPAPGPSPFPFPIPDLNPPGPSPGGLVLLGDPLKLTNARFYRAKLEFSPLSMPPFSPTATELQIAVGLATLGFDNVNVYMNRGELPRDWPQSTMVEGPLSRWFEGRWKHPSATVPRPREIEAMWTSKPPPVPQTSGLEGAYSFIG